MSVEAISWALKQRVGRSSTKHVLTLMANCASAPAHRCYTSMAYLVEASELDRKTVISSIQKLEELGLISDAGERTGRTGQIVVYQLHIDAVDNQSEGSQKRNSSENGTVPKTDGKGPKNGGKGSQKRTETVPKTGHVTEGTKEEQKGTQPRAKRAKVSVHLPDWMPEKSWQDWLDHRAAMKAPFTQRAAELSITVLDRLRSEGHDPVAVIDQSVLRGWTGLFPIRAQQGPHGGQEPQPAGVPSIWWESNEAIKAKGDSLGVAENPGEPARRYMYRVFKAAGPGPWVERELAAASRMNEFEYERVFAYFMGEKPAKASDLASGGNQPGRGA